MGISWKFVNVDIIYFFAPQEMSWPMVSIASETLTEQTELYGSAVEADEGRAKGLDPHLLGSSIKED